MAAIDDYVAKIKEVSDIRDAKMGFCKSQKNTVYEYVKGKKYYKVIVCAYGSKSVHCFVDFDGNIYKAAGWNVPARGIRGNINDVKRPYLSGDFYKTERKTHP